MPATAHQRLNTTLQQLHPRTTAATMANSTAPINCVVVGYGMSGKGFHSYLVTLEPRLKLYGVVARSDKARQAAQKDHPGVHTCGTVGEACQDKAVHIVILATPPSTHFDYAQQALAAGKHVVIDKPITVRYSEFQQLQQLHATKYPQQHIFCFHNRRLDGDYLTVRKLIEDDTIGKVELIEMSYNKGFSVSKQWKLEPTKEGGGRSWDLGIHMCDQVMSLFPGVPIHSVYAHMMYTVHIAPETDSHCLITIVLQNGVTAVLDCDSKRVDGTKPRFNIVGEQGTFVKYSTDPQEPAMMAGRIETSEEDPATYGKIHYRKVEYEQKEPTKSPNANNAKAGQIETVPTINGDWRAFYKNVADVLSGGTAKPFVTLEDCQRTYAAFEGVLRSAETQQVIKFIKGELPSK